MDGEKPYDLDLWVKDNLGHVVSFRRPDDALIHLERDDLGTLMTLIMMLMVN